MERTVPVSGRGEWTGPEGASRVGPGRSPNRGLPAIVGYWLVDKSRVRRRGKQQGEGSVQRRDAGPRVACGAW